MTDIVVVDYRMGNLRSVAKAIEHVAPGREVTVSGDPAVVAAARRVVFPGQGAARDCMAEIDAHQLRPVLEQAARSKPFLGICMGLQVLFGHSDEGDTRCLGLFAGNVRHLPEGARDARGERLKIPHMGWNRVQGVREHPLFAGIAPGERFYFVHSYHVVPDDQGLILATADYPDPFVCAVARDNVAAVQFHPEKSQAAGLRLLENFVNWQP